MIRSLQYVLLVLGCWSLLSCSGETEEKERVIGYVGLAKKNPYLVAERYLQAGGHAVSSNTGALYFSDNQGLVLSPASSVRSVGDSERVLGWVKDGGHFVCFLERGEDYFRDVGDWAHHTPANWSDDSEEQAGLDQLLASLEVEMIRAEDTREEETSEDDAYKEAVAKGKVLPYSEVVTVVADEGAAQFSMQLGGNQTLVPQNDYRPDDWYAAGAEHRFLSRSYGLGRVTFISDARAFRNPYLQLQQHAEMLDYMAAGGGEIVFSLGKVPGFMAMLGEHAWMALYGLLLLTVLWLWKNLPRFGPLLDVSDEDSRSYAQQVSNTGKFLWRHKCDAALLQPLRDAVVRKAGHGYHTHDPDTHALVEKLTAASGLAPEIVTEAMTRTEVRDAHSMVRISKTLQSLLKSL